MEQGRSIERTNHVQNPGQNANANCCPHYVVEVFNFLHNRDLAPRFLVLQELNVLCGYLHNVRLSRVAEVENAAKNHQTCEHVEIEGNLSVNSLAPAWSKI